MTMENETQTTESSNTVAAAAAKAAEKKAAKKAGTSKASSKKSGKKSSKKAAKGERKSRTAFPIEKVQTLWKEGKTIAQIAKACGRYQEGAKDPTASFRGSMNVLRRDGRLKIGFRQEVGEAKPAKKAGAKKKDA